MVGYGEAANFELKPKKQFEDAAFVSTSIQRVKEDPSRRCHLTMNVCANVPPRPSSAVLGSRSMAGNACHHLGPRVRIVSGQLVNVFPERPAITYRIGCAADFADILGDFRANQSAARAEQHQQPRQQYNMLDESLTNSAPFVRHRPATAPVGGRSSARSGGFTGRSLTGTVAFVPTAVAPIPIKKLAWSLPNPTPAAATAASVKPSPVLAVSAAASGSAVPAAAAASALAAISSSPAPQSASHSVPPGPSVRPPTPTPTSLPKPQSNPQFLSSLSSPELSSFQKSLNLTSPLSLAGSNDGVNTRHRGQPYNSSSAYQRHKLMGHREYEAECGALNGLDSWRRSLHHYSTSMAIGRPSRIMSPNEHLIGPLTTLAASASPYWTSLRVR